jgi:Tfp pilus assembly protein FimV
MSTMVLTAPLVGPRRVRATRPATARVASRPAPARVRSVPAPRPVALRLTARGRLVLLALLLCAGLAVSAFTGAISFAGTDATSVPVRYVTVQSGQTLWAIAGEAAPSSDRRDTVAKILELNALPDSGVRAGQRLAVPASH